jgi:5-methylcytosine-specific restriction endonuclease McrA
MKYTRYRNAIRQCVYCGDVADTLEHIPPRSVRNHKLALYIKFKTVHSCFECNNLLGNRLPWDLDGRKEKIKEILAKRYKKALKFQDWTELELQEVSETMRKEIIISMEMKKWIQYRLDC